MIVLPIAVAVLAVSADLGAGAARPPPLTIDPCVEVDEPAVRELIDLELGRVASAGPRPPTWVTVRCVEDAQEIRVEPWASLEGRGVRRVRLPVAENAAPATLEARSRELALAIAELVRSLGLGPHPPPAAPAATVAAPPPDQPPPPRWQLGVLPTLEYFTGGLRLAGADLFSTLRAGGSFSAELRAGGRVGPDETISTGRLAVRAATFSAAAGVNASSQRHPVTGSLAIRAQAYLVQFEATAPAGTTDDRAVLGAFFLALEPKFALGLTRHLFLTAAAAAGVPIRGIRVLAQGAQAPSVSGLLLSASLGAALAF